MKKWSLFSYLLMLSLQTIVMVSCERSEALKEIEKNEKLPTESHVSQKPATDYEHLIIEPYESLYTHEVESEVKSMILAKDDEFMAIYGDFIRKNPEFAEVNGNLRTLFDGAKVSITLGKGLERNEYEMIQDLHRLLIRIQALPNEQPFRAAKVEIARSYETTNTMVASIRLEKILEGGIRELAHPLLKD
ncbi:MAG: hypothetical protein ABIT37_00880 [Luteolibacter sp.]